MIKATLKMDAGRVKLWDDDDGGFWSDRSGKDREWRDEAGAIAFLRRTIAKYTKDYPLADRMVIQLTKLSGDVVVLGERDIDPAKYGPHQWGKLNGVTIIQQGGGSYDLWQCAKCRLEVKSYGLSGRPSGGTCPKNKIEVITGA